MSNRSGMGDITTAARAIELLGLTRLQPEGGHVRQTWRDDASSAIYYLMARPDFSGLHRLSGPEVWAHHLGSPARMLLIDPDGRVTEPILGPDLEAGHRPQLAIPAGTWQAAEPLGPWTLVSTFMAPPYAEDGVTFATWDEMAGQHPGHDDRIRRLCRF